MKNVVTMTGSVAANPKPRLSTVHNSWELQEPRYSGF